MEFFANFFVGGVPAIIGGLIAAWVNIPNAAGARMVRYNVLPAVIGLIVSWVWFMVPSLARDAAEFHFGLVTNWSSAFVVSLAFMLAGLAIPLIFRSGSGPAKFLGKAVAWALVVGVLALAFWFVVMTDQNDPDHTISAFLGFVLVTVGVIWLAKNTSVSKWLGIHEVKPAKKDAAH